MQSEEMALKFALNPEAAAYVRKIEAKGEQRYEKEGDVQRGMTRVEKELKEKDMTRNFPRWYFTS